MLRVGATPGVYGRGLQGYLKVLFAMSSGCLSSSHQFTGSEIRSMRSCLSEEAMQGARKQPGRHGGAMRQTNLIAIPSDEYRPKMAGYAGHPIIRTQNLDRLAALGLDPACADDRHSMRPADQGSPLGDIGEKSARGAPWTLCSWRCCP